MEDYQLDIMIGEGPAARSIKLNLPPFTLVGATTRAGLLTSPLRDRFGIVQRLEFYIGRGARRASCTRSAGILGVPIDAAGAGAHRRALARHAAHRQPPAAPRARLRPGARQRLDRRGHRRRARSTCSRSIRRASMRWTASCCSTIIEKFDGGPVGIESLAAAIGEERGTLEDVIEPYLIQQGFLMRTARGRMATRHAYLHFGLQPAGAGAAAAAAVRRDA